MPYSYIDDADANLKMKCDIQAIERVTLAAVAPEMVHELPGWLLPMDGGTIGRAHSAVPVLHDAASADLALIPAIVAQYAKQGMQAKFRLPCVPAFVPFCDALKALGYVPAYPTLVQIGTNIAMRAVTAQPCASILRAPDAQWASVFSSEAGLSSADITRRLESFTKAFDAVYASVRQDASNLSGASNSQVRATLAVGVGAFHQGWVCVHGVNTAAQYRRQGLAARVLAGIAQAALDKGVSQVVLQVEEANAGAQSLYLRAGFSTAWKYVYWQLPAALKSSC